MPRKKTTTRKTQVKKSVKKNTTSSVKSRRNQTGQLKDFPEYVPSPPVKSRQRVGRVIIITASTTLLLIISLIAAYNLWYAPYLSQPQILGQVESKDVPAGSQPLGVELNLPETPAPSPKPSDPTQDWLSFQNQDYWLKYPANWQLNTSTSEVSLSNDLANVLISIKVEISNLDLDQYIAQLDRTNILSTRNKYTLNTQEKGEINGQYAVVRQLSLDNQEQVVTYLKSNNKIVIIKLTADSLNLELNEFYQQLLSTFNLIAQAPVEE